MMTRTFISTRSPWRMFLALLCIVLVISTATVELTHHHADGEHADCALCLIAHVVIQTVSAPALIAVFVRLAAVAVAARVLLVQKARLSAFFIRPPPVMAAA